MCLFCAVRVRDAFASVSIPALVALTLIGMQGVGCGFSGYKPPADQLSDASYDSTGEPNGDAGFSADAHIPETAAWDAAMQDASALDGAPGTCGTRSRDAGAAPGRADQHLASGCLPDDARVDSEVPLADSGSPSVPLAVPLGRDGGCPGTPRRVYTFDTPSLDGWLLTSFDPPGTAAVAFSADVGSPSLGALQVSAPFMLSAQSVKVGRDLEGAVSLSCMSARIMISPGSLTADLSRFPGQWSLFAVSGACFAQAETLSGDFPSGLSAANVWYEVAFDVTRFAGQECAFDPGAVNVVGVTIAPSPSDDVRAAVVYIDSVMIW